MSAQSCGCDAEAGWICEVHRAPTKDKREPVEVVSNQEAWQRVVALQNAMNHKTSQALEVVEISESVDASLARIEAIIDAMVAEMAVIKCREQRIALVLATFYRAPVSISSLQPILELAVELNPELRGQ